MRRKLNTHEIWQRCCTENTDLLEGLPGEVVGTEKKFRTFVTHGLATDSNGQEVANLEKLTDKQIAGLWKFISVATEFDMDAMLFDAFNTEWRSRGCPKFDKI